MRLIADQTLEYISQPFKYFEIFFIITYAIIYIGIISSEPKWVHTISIIFHIFICTFLLNNSIKSTKNKAIPITKNVIANG